jgi:nucleotide-binding universal stress UspA family protein
MRQVAPFSELWLYRREEEDGDEAAQQAEEAGEPVSSSGENEPGAGTPHEETP